MGSGKSTAARLLAARGWTVIDADREAKLLMNGEPLLKRRLVETFGGAIAGGEGISFGALGTLVFGDKENLKRLNALVHPPLLGHLKSLADSHGAKPWVLDAALIPLWKIEFWFDVCLWVSAPPEVRLGRLLQTASGLNEPELRRRMRLQEENMPEPGAPQWIFLPNEGDVALLDDSLKNAIESCHGF
jgi:dephospho-CoA kinase